MTSDSPPPTTNRLAVASLIVSLGAFSGVFCVFLGFAAPVGMVMGARARKQVHNDPHATGEGIATAGALIGAAGTLLLVFYWLFYLARYGLQLFGEPPPQ